MGEEKNYPTELIAEAVQTLPLAHTKEIRSYTEFCDEINYLIRSDFHSLVNILYRMDVSETRITEALAGEPGMDAAKIIADLMLERQLEKMKTREQFNRNDDIADEEKW
jgi:hypothetical protein